MRPLVLGAVVVSGALLALGCESSQSKSARLEREAEKLGGPGESLTIDKKSTVVEVKSSQALQDPNGAAAVVELRHTGKTPIAGVPVLIDVQDKAGTSLFKNDVDGTEASLVSAASLAPGQTLFWVNDQIVAVEQPEQVVAQVGEATGKAPAALPELVLSEPKLEEDPASGVAAVGTVENRSDLEQRQLVVYAVARKGGKIVAAGRGQIPKLKAGGTAPYTVFFIGDPKGAELTLAAPPTVLEAGS